MIEPSSTVPNTCAASPFACLPNHVVGKGMFREVRRRYPQANVAIDHDPAPARSIAQPRIAHDLHRAHGADGTEPGRLDGRPATGRRARQHGG